MYFNCVSSMHFWKGYVFVFCFFCSFFLNVSLLQIVVGNIRYSNQSCFLIYFCFPFFTTTNLCYCVKEKYVF
ncbi:hypothetical protein BC829DRAFT_385465, partial [Chytridium lagenaria]